MWTRPLAFQFPYAIAFLVVYVGAFFVAEWSVHARTTRSAVTYSPADQRTVRLLMTAMSLSQLAAFVSAFYLPFRFEGRSILISFFVGLVIVFFASVLRRHCMRQLGEYFTSEVRVAEGQPVIESGAYGLLRHPSYAAAILMFLGLGFALTNWVSVSVLGLSAIATYHYRLVVEEAALVSALGEPYRRFLQSRKRLIPYVY